MAQARLKFCAAPGCPERTFRGYCKAHASIRRGTTTERGYGGQWPRIRARVLFDEPLCRHCAEGGRVTAASEVDHIVPLSRGGARLDRRNLQPLCGECHRAKTLADRGVLTHE